MSGHLIPDSRVRLVVATLIFGSILSLGLLGGRLVYSDKAHLTFYVWNLILAWLPLIFALRAYQLDIRHQQRWWLLAVWAALWFFFFPNAPYLVTDFLHFKTRSGVPKWFDLILMMSFAWTGLLLGYLSLLLMQEIVRRRRGVIWGWAFAIAMLALGSFGIYLGRFQRWNSWDVLARPFGLAGDVIRQLDSENTSELFGFIATFFVFSLLTYPPLYALTHLRDGQRPPTADEERKPVAAA